MQADKVQRTKEDVSLSNNCAKQLLSFGCFRFRPKVDGTGRVVSGGVEEGGVDEHGKPGTDAMILKIFSPKNFVKRLAFFCANYR
jgi:hypothetical protein